MTFMQMVGVLRGRVGRPLSHFPGKRIAPHERAHGTPHIYGGRNSHPTLSAAKLLVLGDNADIPLPCSGEVPGILQHC